MSDDGRKIFVGGLSPTTTFQSLGAAFSAYGEIVESNVVMDKVTGNSKGYGFVIFTDAENAQRAVAEGFVTVDGKSCNCNISSLGNQLTKNNRGKQNAINDPNNGNHMMGNNYHHPYGLNDSEGQVSSQLQSMYSDIQSVKFELSLLNGSVNQIKQTMFAMKQSLDSIIVQNGVTNGSNGIQSNGAFINMKQM